ncbi:hypothetical protein CCAX7_55880 [Capsulimonas corticalis]|uniref:Uncharacterized protein n=1 Tax=Capsulimonas corticalis TaxID=2219043 RepID=A0A402D0V5_9BACT|nr:hypothetical protein [Capsulimonas corticalis]BDI33537.1 hypothetical protein CCAX7_55880 [Capsulimonas corticalis]
MYTITDTCMVRTAAAKIRAIMATRAGGRLPRTERGWERLLASFGVDIWECRRHTRHFRARLRIDPRGAAVYLSPRLTPYQKMRVLCHELAEYIAVTLYPSPADDLCADYHYDGGAQPQDYRHLVAREVERLAFPRLPLFWAVRPTPR